MKTLTPWAPTMRQELARYLSRFDDDFPVLSKDVADWTPALDVTEANGNFIVKAECPGMEAKDLRVRVQNDVLTIEGEKVSDIHEKTERAYRRERSYGSFSRDIRFPTPTDGTKVKAHLANGILTLTVPKAAAAGSATIPITVG